MSEYGRYIADDGMPRWSLPPKFKQRSLRRELIVSAIKECYADYGATWLHRRMDNAPSVARIRHYASDNGIKCNANGRKVAWGIDAESHRKLRVQNKLAVMSGLPKPNNMPVATIPRKAIPMRYNLMRRNGYEYGEIPWMLYNASTRRRKDEEAITRKYGIKFADAEEDAI